MLAEVKRIADNRISWIVKEFVKDFADNAEFQNYKVEVAFQRKRWQIYRGTKENPLGIVRTLRSLLNFKK